MSPSADNKVAALKALARQRREAAAGTREHGYSRDYKHVEAFHDGRYDNDWPSPWTVSARNVDSPIVLVGQDWASERFLAGPLNTSWQPWVTTPVFQPTRI